jgi:hypothetical protein
MPIAQSRLLKVLLRSIDSLDETQRVQDYKDEVKTILSDIVLLERQHSDSPTRIQQRVGDKVSALGVYLFQNGWKPENREGKK